MFRYSRLTLSGIMMTVALGMTTSVPAAENPATKPAVQELQFAPPDVALVGIVNTGGNNDHAILRVEGKEQVVYSLDTVIRDWWLDAINQDHVLLSDGEQRVKIDLYHGRPTRVSTDEAGQPTIRTRPTAIHTESTHADLAPGQKRTFYNLPEPTEESSDDGPMAQWQAIQNEINDPGMSRRFSSAAAPAPETGESDDLEFVANSAAPLEPGQSRSFGPPPPAETETAED